MNKIILTLLFCLASVPVYATVNYKTVWDAEEEILSIRDNYGTALSEEIRMDLQRKKGYYYFKLLKTADTEKPVNIDLQSEGWEGLSYGLTDSGGNIIENFKPVIADGRLFHLRWDAGELELRAGDFPVYRSDTPFRFIGKRSDNLLIMRAGRLEWLDEVEWQPVSPLQGYAVSYLRWIDENNILIHAERDSDGRRQIVLSSVRRPAALFLPMPPGEFVEAAASPDRSRVYALCRDGGGWLLYGYSFPEDEWSRIREFKERVYLLDMPGETLLWYNPEENALANLDSSITLAGTEELFLYPEGKYLYGEEGGELRVVEPVIQRALYYPSGSEKNIAVPGYPELSAHGAGGRLWLLPEKYKGTLQRLSARSPGHLFLSPEDMSIYYDTGRDGLRQIKVLRLRPSSPGRIILILLSALLLLLIINEFRRTAKRGKK